MAIIDIDLAKYGGEGVITIGPQSLRKQCMLKNETSKRMYSISYNAETQENTMVPQEVNAGDIEIMQVLSYVRKAPFVPMLDSFLAFCDALEEKTPGSSMDLYEEMTAAVEEVSKKPSPLEH